jgi:cytochrome c-type biogenesis protein CcmF
MLIGFVVVWLGVLFASMSLLIYAFSGRRPGLKRWARFCFLGAFGMILATEGVLQYALITGRYDLEYVFSFSQRDLHLWYKMAGAWAGQEGSFLLWTVWTGVYGVILMLTARSYERWVMMVYSGLVLCLMAILAYQSPFALIAPENRANLGTWPPPDGFGLNASLENIWMTIHPPIIFAGFAALAVPFVYGWAALMRNEYQEWIIRVRPWAIYATTMLGFGLVLGGYWAYETLGWGGFWAWDPVENTSYIPWLFMASFVHGIMLQTNRGKLIRWNPFLSTIPFLMFLYGTYLTRSGVMSEVSVHSFVALDNKALLVLLGMIGAGGLGTLGMWLFRWRQMPKPQQSEQARGLSRQNAMLIGIWLLITSAVITLIATSYPMITQWIKGKPDKLDISFYHQVHAPWILLIAILLAAAPFLSWRGMRFDALLDRLTKAWLFTLVCAFSLFFLGYREPVTLLVVTMLIFTASANFGAIWRRIRTSRMTIGGFLMHMGLAIGLIGLVISNAYEVKQRVVVLAGQDTNAFGYRWRYLGMTGDERQFGEQAFDKSNRVRVEVANHTEKFVVEPRFYKDIRRADNNNVYWPWIRRWWNHDLYISFIAPPQVIAEPLSAEMEKGETQTVSDYTLKFLEFKREGSMGQQGFRAVARVEVSKKGWAQPVMAEPARQIVQGSVIPIPASLPDGEQLLIRSMDVNSGAVTLEMIMVPGRSETVPRMAIPLEVYYKPLTLLVWLGPPIALLGGLLAVVRRVRDSKYALEKIAPALHTYAGNGKKIKPVAKTLDPNSEVSN